MPSDDEDVRKMLQVLKDLDEDFSVLSVHVNKAFPFKKIDEELQAEVSGKIVDDIFRHVALAKNDAPECWKKAHRRLMRGKLLDTTMDTRLAAYSGWKTIKSYSTKAMGLYQETGKLPCLSAPVMISVIALLFYRKISLDEASMEKSSPNVLELFGVHDTTKWLRVAILVSAQVDHKNFLVEVDHEMVAPQVRKGSSGSDNFSIVTTAEQPTHQYRGLVNSRFRRTQLQLGSGHREPLPSEGSDRESTASTDDDDDSPIEQVVTRSITRAQALERAGDLVNQVRNPKFNQVALKDPMGLWLTEPVIRVLPMDLKKKVLLYCSHHLPNWRAKIEEHYYDLRDEHTWQETIEVAPAAKVSYGKETLGSLLAKLKAVEPKIHPTELRDVVTGVRREMRPHGKYWDKLSEDMASVLKGSGTSTAEQRKTLAEELSQQRQALDEERQDLEGKVAAFAQQQETFAEEMSQQRQALAPRRQALDQVQQSITQERQALDRDRQSITQQRQALDQERQALGQDRLSIAQQREALDQERQAMADTSDVEKVWEWFLDSKITIPIVVRMLVRDRCSGDTIDRLVEMEDAQN